MKKIEVIYSDYNEATGISTVSILTDLGKFTATSKLHEEDKKISSSFAGCDYARTKAILKYMKARERITKAQIKSLIDFQNMLKSLKQYEHNSIENRKLRKQIYILKNKLKVEQERRETLVKKLHSRMEKRESVIRYIQERNDNNGK